MPATGIALTPTSSTRHLVAWVKRLELVQAQRRRPLETLRAAYEAIVGCVDDAVDASFDFAEDDIVIEFLDGSRYPFYLLSDGQRRMAGTAADIAMRCAQLNPHLNGQALTETPGVVLIDEIDLTPSPALAAARRGRSMQNLSPHAVHCDDALAVHHPVHTTRCHRRS